MTWGIKEERGSVTVFATILGTALLALIVLVANGATKLRTTAHANAIAGEAARIATQAIDARSAQALKLDQTAGIRAATTYLAQAKTRGTVTWIGSRTVKVTVRMRGRYLIPFGTDTFETTGQAKATAAIGVSSEDAIP